MTSNEHRDYLQELKSFVLLHCEAQQLKTQRVQQVLGKITHAEGNEAGSWCAEWCRQAQRQEQLRDWAQAAKLFNMARFPFAENEMQFKAHLACIENFKKSMNEAGVKLTTLALSGGVFKAYAAGLDRGWPVLVVCGGIVSIKEQWQRFLLLAERLRLCVVATEMPGVGENALRYTPQAWTLFPQILDALEGRADTRQCHLMAMSFSGHLALRAAADARIRGITTVGAPIASFFRQYSNATVPEVTRRTLSHLTGLTQESLFIQIRDWQIDANAMPRLTIPVHYLQSEHDEIIPLSESHALNEIAADARVYRLPDVHGSPNNMHLVAPWALASILSSFPARRKQAFIFRMLWKTKALLHRRRRFNPSQHSPLSG
ncbi:alpha/beta fold hydrolase [Serratia marcescens]|uniref:alpha/beta fold hydrolase n=1 Tax=Serratia marcescens TaxID=615 RepID=UPI001C580E47|nr:alpha/beta hydrolase [Serratia marcescens]QXX95821.1 alpha/beta fold hydrolase [Serratia marcescens]